MSAGLLSLIPDFDWTAPPMSRGDSYDFLRLIPNPTDEEVSTAAKDLQRMLVDLRLPI